MAPDKPSRRTSKRLHGYRERRVMRRRRRGWTSRLELCNEMLRRWNERMSRADKANSRLRGRAFSATGAKAEYSHRLYRATAL